MNPYSGACNLIIPINISVAPSYFAILLIPRHKCRGYKYSTPMEFEQSYLFPAHATSHFQKSTRLRRYISVSLIPGINPGTINI